MADLQLNPITSPFGSCFLAHRDDHADKTDPAYDGEADRWLLLDVLTARTDVRSGYTS